MDLSFHIGLSSSGLSTDRCWVAMATQPPSKYHWKSLGSPINYLEKLSIRYRVNQPDAHSVNVRPIQRLHGSIWASFQRQFHRLFQFNDVSWVTCSCATGSPTWNLEETRPNVNRYSSLSCCLLLLLLVVDASQHLDDCWLCSRDTQEADGRLFLLFNLERN